MSEPDAVALPREGEVFFDVRGEARSMRLSWYADSAVAVFSIWQGNRCTATFRLPFGDLARMVDTLRSGPPAHAAPAHPAGRSFETSRSDPGHDYLPQPDYGPAAAYGEEQAHEPATRYLPEPDYEPRAPYGSSHGSWSEQGYRSGHHVWSNYDDGPEGDYRSVQDSRQDYESRDYRSQDYPSQDYEARGAYPGEPGYAPYAHYERPRHERPSSRTETAPYLAAPAHPPRDSSQAARAYRDDDGRPAAAYAQSGRHESGPPASAPAHAGDSRRARFPAAHVTTERAEPDFDTATAAYRDR